jgi:hypothetical protein
MGYGDEIMAAGHAESQGHPVRIVGTRGETRWHPLWEGNPYITRRMSDPAIRNGPGCRPYLEYPFTHAGGAHFTGWRARDHRGRLYGIEPGGVSGMVVIEPNLASDGNPNKRWPLERWQSVVDARPDIPWLQMSGPHALRGVTQLRPPSFRVACGILAGARAALVPEGGLHHAAAALQVPAVVLFGQHTPLEVTGYPEQMNLTGGDGEACGKWLPCEHCARAMDRITVDEVLRALDYVA